MPVALTAMPTMTSSVTSALSGAASAGVPSGTLPSRSKMIGITVTGISMITVPATGGVSIRRNRDSRLASPNWNSEDMMTSVASIAGPPSAMAVMQTAMKAPDVPIRST